MFSQLLIRLRKEKRMSQFKLALEADISQKHLSFLESERTSPSRDMVETLSQVLQLDEATSNHLMASAGFSIVYHNNQPVFDAETFPGCALIKMLENHAPYPATITHRNGELITSNKSMRMFLSKFLDKGTLQKYINGYELFFAQDGMRPFVQNWEVFASYTLLTLRKRLMMEGSKSDWCLWERLYQNTGLSIDSMLESCERGNEDVAAVHLVHQGQLIRFRIMTTLQYGFSTNGESDFLLELIFPIDQDTADWFSRLD